MKVYEIDFYESDIERTLQSYLFNKIKYPDQFLQKPLMPNFGFNDEDIEALTTALLSMNKESVPDELLVLPLRETSYQPEGAFREIIDRYSCLSCHIIHGKGFLMASDLSNQGSRVHKEWLRNYFRNPDTLRPILAERMPDFYSNRYDHRHITYHRICRPVLYFGFH